MKKLVIVLALLLLVIPISLTKEVEILDVRDGQSGGGLEVGATYYAVMNDQIVASVENNEVNYYHKNWLNSNIAGEGRSKTLPFGQELLNPDSRFTFTGKEEDSSGLYYFGARYYDSDLGRFVSTDPVVDNHAYVYTMNNPLRFVDPSGGDEETVTAPLVEAILEAHEEQTQKRLRGERLSCTEGLISVLENLESYGVGPVRELSRVAGARSQYEAVFNREGEVIDPNFVELSADEAREFADAGGLVVVLYPGLTYLGLGTERSGHVAVVAPIVEELTSLAQGRFAEELPFVFEVGGGRRQLVQLATLQGAIASYKHEHVKYVMSFDQYQLIREEVEEQF